MSVYSVSVEVELSDDFGYCVGAVVVVAVGCRVVQ